VRKKFPTYDYYIKGLIHFMIMINFSRYLI